MDGAVAVLPTVGRLALVTDVALTFPIEDDALFVVLRRRGVGSCFEPVAFLHRGR